MSMPAEKPRRYTIEDYFRIARDSTERLEYIDGEIVAMAGGTYNHSLIVANFGGELRNKLKGKPCRALESNLRVGIVRAGRYTYPDIPVVCGPPQFDPRDAETIVNPRVLIEVLSPSTERSDRGEKFNRYRLLESLQEYILVSQDKPLVECFLRQSDGGWLLMHFAGMEAIAKLRSLEVELPLAEIYAGVEFPPAEEDESAAAAQ
jgi:Uma2 family endonuclease